MKLLFKSLLTALLLLCSIVVSAKEKCTATNGWKEFTNIVEVNGKCGDNIYWSFDNETGKLTIYGEGEMYHDNWYGSSVPWKSEKSNIKSVDILEGVTNVGSWSFQGCDALTSVTLPNSITDIGEYAFMGCSKLTNITIPNSATTIGGWGFCFCI